MTKTINTIRELKEFWLAERPTDTSTGETVVRYIVRVKPVRGHPGEWDATISARLIDRNTGKLKTKFFMYLDDAFHNANILNERREVSNETGN
ncbi:MAG TPA: hypothetical protein PKV77_10090 [Bacteroidales bacterium]|jgi:hypothetical protein|nr:hypothetical protein [Bacteroidales bacterium]HPV27505.1 hypothetical protein [Bacteroidales bacterium]HRR45270.1 hypothetical protein [Mesotoga sp.]